VVVIISGAHAVAGVMATQVSCAVLAAIAHSCLAFLRQIHGVYRLGGGEGRRGLGGGEGSQGQCFVCLFVCIKSIACW
jgi:hypothetical protein